MRLNIIETHIKKMAHKIAAADDAGVAAYVTAQCEWLRNMGENLADYELVRDSVMTDKGSTVTYKLVYTSKAQDNG